MTFMQKKTDDKALLNTLETVLKQEMLPKAINALRSLFEWVRDSYGQSQPPPVLQVFQAFFGPYTSQEMLADRITTVLTHLAAVAASKPWKIYHASQDPSHEPAPSGAIGYESEGNIYLLPAFYTSHFAFQYDTLLHEALHAIASAIDIPGLDEGRPVNSFTEARQFAIQSPHLAVDCAYNLTLFTLVAAGLLKLPQ
jgi:hypothetical protein